MKSIVFLPGWGFKACLWETVLSSFKPYDTRLIDLPSINDKNDFKNLPKNLSKLIPKNSIMIAWSLSGLIAIQLAYRYSQQVTQLILISALPKFVSAQDWLGICPKLMKRFRRRAQSNVTELLAAFVNLVQFPDTSLSKKLVLKQNIVNGQPQSLLNYLDFFYEIDVREYLKQLNIAVHFIFGEQDAIIPSISATQLLKYNTNISFTIIPDAGHIPFLSHQEAFVSTVLGLIK